MVEDIDGIGFKTADSLLLDMEKASNCLYLSNQLCKAMAVLLKPYIPNKADAICEIINIPTENTWDDAKVFLETGHEINKAKPLFKKIEDKVIEEQKEKLYKNLETQENESKDDKKEDKKSEESKDDEGEKMDLISIDEFAKVEIKIGKILECEKIEKSNKLLKRLCLICSTKYSKELFSAFILIQTSTSEASPSSKAGIMLFIKIVGCSSSRTLNLPLICTIASS